jgi:hypothetical protein
MNATDDPSPDEVFATMTIALVEAIKRSFPNDEPNYAGLVLLHSAFDIISSLSRPIAAADTSRSVFEDWINAYMLPDSGLKCRASDIYSTRCGLLHTLSLSSRGSRSGKARQLSFLNKESGVDGLQAICKRRGHNIIIVAISTYRRAFFKGIARFTDQIKQDKELRDRVFHHVKNVPLSIRFDLRP